MKQSFSKDKVLKPLSFESKTNHENDYDIFNLKEQKILNMKKKMNFNYMLKKRMLKNLTKIFV
jgi:hypothetical protein